MDFQARRRAAAAVVVAVAAWVFMWFRRTAQDARSGCWELLLYFAIFFASSCCLCTCRVYPADLKMAWYVVYRGRKPGVYETWVACHQQVTGYPNCCYRSFSCKEEAIASYLETSGDADDKLVVKDEKKGVQKTPCLQVIIVLQFIVIVALLLVIISIM